MISDELKAIKDDLEKKGKMHFLEGAKEEEILDFEEKSEIHLPKKYREWLMISDGGEFFLPAGVSNSFERAVRRMVPPVCTMLLTSSVVKDFTSSLIRPS